MLHLYDADMEGFGDLDSGDTYEDPLRTRHDGHLGGADERIIHVRNQDPALYYTQVRLVPELIADYQDLGEFGLTGWGVKLMYGRRRPTDAEWDRVRSMDGIELPDIGSKEAADTFTNHPVWVRVFCPGGEPAQIRKSVRLRLSYRERLVGEP